MKQDHPYVGVDGIITNENGEILLMHRTAGAYTGYWGLIAGAIEWGEEVEDALKREAIEEIGVELGNIKLSVR